MTEKEQKAYEWAINQKFQSVAARNARILAEYIKRIEKISQSEKINES